ncbi:MAG TPA: GGDEF domain-containing protein [Solirubrobacterales bacterium]|nr:GGDEF domain-containing protein [Solirubrobacterales bacterium]
MSGRAPDQDEQGGATGERLDRPGRMAIEVAERHRSLLATLREELGAGAGAHFAAAAERLAEDFGEVTATAVEAAYETVRDEGRAGGTVEFIRAPREELPSLYRPGHMRRRLDQLIETNRRYGHPFGLAVFDTSGPDTKQGVDAEMALAVVSAALRDSIRIVDEAFRLEEEAICVLAPNLRTVEGMQMAERLLAQLEELEQAGGLRIAVTAGVVACPDHGADADQLLHKADAAMWRARAVGQPVGVGGLSERS